jgi:hypothetical protein
VQTASHASTNKESSETEDEEQCNQASSVLLQGMYPWSCTCGFALFPRERAVYPLHDSGSGQYYSKVDEPRTKHDG